MMISVNEIVFKVYGIQGYVIRFEKKTEDIPPPSNENIKNIKNVNKNKFFALSYEMNSKVYHGEIKEGF